MADKTWDEGYPVGTTHAMNVVDDDLRDLKYAIREREAIDHNWFADESGESNLHYHKKVSLIDQGSDPTTHGAGGVGYTKSGDFYFKNSGATVVQITDGAGLAAVNSDNITRGFGLTYSSTTAVIVEPGTLFHGSTRVDKTARTTLTLATNGDWIDGSSPTLTSIHIYIYVKSDGTIKLEETAPAYADTAGNTVGKLIYHLEGSVYWRWIGQVWTDSAGAIVKFYNIGDWILYDDPKGDADLQCIDVTNNVASFTAASCLTKGVPATSQLVRLNLVIQPPSASNTAFYFRATGSSATNGIFVAIYTDNTVDYNGNLIDVPLNSSQSLDYKATFGNGDFDAYVAGYYSSRN